MTISLREIGGYASLLAGILLILGHALNLGGNIQFGTVIGSTLVFAAHTLLVFSFTGIYFAQGRKNGWFGFLGMTLGSIGTIASSAVVFVEISGASGKDVEFVYATGVPNMIRTVLPLLFVIGLIMIAISMIRVKKLPQISGYSLIVGTIVFLTASFIGKEVLIFEFFGALFAGIGFTLVGIPLIRKSS